MCLKLTGRKKSRKVLKKINMLFFTPVEGMICTKKVMLLLSKEIAECMTDYKLISERIMRFKRWTPHSVSGLCPRHIVRSDVESDMFYEQAKKK